MEISTGIEQRRAIKVFDPEQQISDAEIEKLMTLTTLAPTAFNVQHWRFVLVRDPELRRRIRAASWDQAQVTDSSLLVIICADTRAWNKQAERYWPNAGPEAIAGLVGAVRNYYEGKPQIERDEALRSCGLAAATLMLAAQDLGWDTCPMDGFDFDAVGELINLPEDHLIAMFVAVGKRTQEPRPRSGKLPLAEVLVENRFPAS